MYFKTHPVTTVTSLLVIAAYFLLEPSASWGNTREGILNGEVWRLFSSNFVHRDLQHCLLNVTCFWVGGLMVERQIGSWRFLALLLSIAVGESLAFDFFYPVGIAFGLSAVCYGVSSACIAQLYFKTPSLRTLLLGSCVLVIPVAMSMIGKKVDAFYLAYLIPTEQVAHLPHVIGGVVGFLAYRFLHPAYAALIEEVVADPDSTK